MTDETKRGACQTGTSRDGDDTAPRLQKESDVHVRPRCCRLALALLPLALAVALRWRHARPLLWRAVLLRWLRDRLTGLRVEERALQFVQLHALPGDPPRRPQHLRPVGAGPASTCPCLGPDKGNALGSTEGDHGAVGPSVAPLAPLWPHLAPSMAPIDSSMPHWCLSSSLCPTSAPHLPPMCPPPTGRVVERLVRGRCPRGALQLGSRCGYSAVVVGRSLPHGATLLILESDPRRVDIALRVLRLAGLRPPAVSVLCGSPESLFSHWSFPPLDLVLLAEDPQRFLRTLRLLERRRLLASDALLLTHRAALPAAAPLFRYLRSSGKYRCRIHRSTVEFHPRIRDDVIEIRFLGYG
ncbi:LOW QUALITY PROTEIN: transmembrane O-methyltransferase homolog [Cuculus canorus]|uniref:LOW QUALITY PROTEIN: transmembrane O-methyltransferase homolog n=1 Tax=Cuculus canorus TaxID=55661 RepID=UPI0023AA54F8|nr:LOW QUALITY PROTEIN: transmembrane O-methyltransferase homolog [Cuculus canorus]